MVFKINQSVINKKKRSPLYVLLYISLLAALFSLPQKEQDFDWAKFLIIFGVVGAFSAGSNFVGSRRFIKYAETHKVEITAEGIKSYETDSFAVMPWDSILSVKEKTKNGKITKLFIKTSSGKIDLSRYDNLELLVRELKRFLNPTLWS